MGLTVAEIDAFVEQGFVRIAGAVDREVAQACHDELWDVTGYDRDDQSTWTDTLVRVPGLGTAPFTSAANSGALLEAFDQLVGPGRWVPRTGLGTFPLRFPGPGAAKEAGWHIEASYEGAAGEWRVNLTSRGRALLMLFLFSEVAADDAPTLVRIGSHLDVPRLLQPAGEDGMDWMAICRKAVPASAHRPVTAVTGELGDVYLCHPFLVHSAQAHRGTRPRFMAQPPLEPAVPLELTSPFPVERAIAAAL